MAHKRAINSGVEEWNIVDDVVNRPTRHKLDVTLLRGVAWLIIASIIGWYFRLAPTSMVSFVPVGYVSLSWHVVLNAIIWIVSSAVPFLFAALLCRKAPVAELFGRMLYAHMPVLLLMLPAIVGNKIAYATFMSTFDSLDLAMTFSLQPTYSTLMLIMASVVIVWTLYWSYNVFSSITKRRGVAMFLAFVVMMIVSQYLTVATLESVYSSVLR